MAETSPDHSAVWVRQLIAELHSRKHPVEPILKAAKLDRAKIDADGARIPITAHAAIFELAAQSVDDDCLGLRFGATRDVRDAGLICAAQKIEHYEIASYGCLRTFASLVGRTGDIKALDKTLNEEKKADSALTSLAMSVVNVDAAA